MPSSNPVTFFENHSTDSYSLFQSVGKLRGNKLNEAVVMLFERKDAPALIYHKALMLKWCYQDLPEFDRTNLDFVVNCVLKTIKHTDLRYKLLALYFCSKLIGFTALPPLSVERWLKQHNEDPIDLTIFLKKIYNQGDEQTQSLDFSEYFDSSFLQHHWGNLLLIAPELTQLEANKIVSICMAEIDNPSSHIKLLLGRFTAYISASKANELCNFLYKRLLADLDPTSLQILDMCIYFISPPVLEALINSNLLIINNIKSYTPHTYSNALAVLQICALRANHTQKLKIMNALFNAFEQNDIILKVIIFSVMCKFFPHVDDKFKDKVLTLGWDILNSQNAQLQTAAYEAMRVLLSQTPTNMMYNILLNLVDSTELFTQRGLWVARELIDLISQDQCNWINARLLNPKKSFSENLKSDYYDILLSLAGKIHDIQIEEKLSVVAEICEKEKKLPNKANCLVIAYKQRLNAPEFKQQLNPPLLIEPLFSLVVENLQKQSIPTVIQIIYSLRSLCGYMNDEQTNKITLSLLPCLSHGNNSLYSATLRLFSDLTLHGKISQEQFDKLITENISQHEIITLNTISLIYDEVDNALNYKMPAPSNCFN